MRNVESLKLDNVNSWKNRLDEKLIDIIDFQDFNSVVNDERIQSLMNITLREFYKKNNSLGENYKYVFGEFPEILDMTLGEYLSSISIYERGFIKIYISEGKDIEGLIFYILDRTDIKIGNIPRVQDICVLYFDIDKNQMVLAKGTYSLVKELCSKYSLVHWIALKENPACDFYKRTSLKYGGAWNDNKKNRDILHFYIPEKSDYEIKESLENTFSINNDILDFNLVKYNLVKYYYYRNIKNEDIQNLAKKFDIMKNTI